MRMQNETCYGIIIGTNKRIEYDAFIRRRAMHEGIALQFIRQTENHFNLGIDDN